MAKGDSFLGVKVAIEHHKDEGGREGQKEGGRGEKEGLFMLGHTFISRS